jgi:toxin ParE1/3/4
MSSAEPPGYRLSPRALDDLEEIWRYSAETWSIDQADRYVDDLARLFGLIATLPSLGQERRDINPPVRIHAHGRHVIVYVEDGADVTILRLLGTRQDWLAIIQAADW